MGMQAVQEAKAASAKSLSEGPAGSHKSAPTASRRFLATAVVSTVALAVSITTAYWTFWRPVSIHMAVSSSMYVSNTLGRIPDAVVDITVRGAGSNERAKVVQRIEMTIKPLAKGREDDAMILESLGYNANLPWMITGSTLQSVEVTFSLNPLVHQKLDIYRSWCDEMRGLLPENKHDEIRVLQERLDSHVFTERIRGGIGIADSIDRPRLSDMALDLLRGLEGRSLEKLLFFLPGDYEVIVVALDQEKAELTRQAFRFTIPSTMPESLRLFFENPTRVRLESL